eukprot:SAG31_NODE_161_length_21899_cov_16.832844_15_plen_164_part_00
MAIRPNLRRHTVQLFALAMVARLAQHGGVVSVRVPPAGSLVHPGILVSLPMLEQIRTNVRAKRQPQWDAYRNIMNPNHTIGPTEGGRAAVWLANLSYVPEPEKLWLVNQSLSPGTRWLSDKEDALAAYTHALLWFITEDERHARKVRAVAFSFLCNYSRNTGL